MAQSWTKEDKWIEIGISTAGTVFYVPDIINGRETGRQTRHRMTEAAPLIHANAEAAKFHLGHWRIFRRCNKYISDLGVTAQFLAVLQGPRTQAALRSIDVPIAANGEGDVSSETVALRVHELIVQCTTRYRQSKSYSHVFFLCHPDTDTDWDWAFFRCVQDQPLSHRFLGMSQNLDALVVWMRFVKKNMDKDGKKIHIHLLIPAYRPMVAGESLAFSADLMPLTIHGHVHSSMPYVWLNLPKPSRRLQLINVGNLANVPCYEIAVSPFEVLGMTATAAAGRIAGPLAAAFVGSYFLGNSSCGRTQSRRRFISTTDPRTLDDDRSSDDD
ncbi:hypothetical protein S40285_00069 [Stachybotrys chlorohalonatus IBT 40285]|uniref:Uncharacterized protein n=1 Tax=Stachybotrys chlorohalonatus (strain IBT 40285) TaxID=1283841 RepID=A0A084QYQ8_STAC4|nr:hypothetical protein S40285_00069 [Stachybotrys chlorohalonata IBT 40285]